MCLFMLRNASFFKQSREKLQIFHSENSRFMGLIAYKRLLKYL